MEIIIAIGIVLAVLILAKVQKGNSARYEEKKRNSLSERSVILYLSDVATKQYEGLDDDDFKLRYGIDKSIYLFNVSVLKKIFSKGHFVSLDDVKKYDSTWYKVAKNWFDINKDSDFTKSLFVPLGIVSKVWDLSEINKLNLDDITKYWLLEFYERSKKANVFYAIEDKFHASRMESRLRYVDQLIRINKFDPDNEEDQEKILVLLRELDEKIDKLRE